MAKTEVTGLTVDTKLDGADDTQFVLSVVNHGIASGAIALGERRWMANMRWFITGCVLVGLSFGVYGYLQAPAIGKLSPGLRANVISVVESCSKTGNPHTCAVVVKACFKSDLLNYDTNLR